MGLKRLNSLMGCTLSCLIIGFSSHSYAQNHAADWAYFQDGWGNQHAIEDAIDLKALKWRSDSLLESGTRHSYIPRLPDTSTPWTKEERSRAYFGYSRQLIDCETGAFVVTEEDLLDEQGVIVARRSMDIETIRASLLNISNKDLLSWPHKADTEILLACTSASDDSFLKRRREMAKIAPPLLSDTPLEVQLINDKPIALDREEWQADFVKLKKAKPKTPDQVLTMIFQQKVDWLRKVNKPFNPPNLTSAFSSKTQRELEEGIRSQVDWDLLIQVLDQNHIEFGMFTHEYREYEYTGKTLPKTIYQVVVHQIDCRTSTVVPQRLLRYGGSLPRESISKSRIIQTKPVSMKMVWKTLDDDDGRVYLGTILCEAKNRLKKNHEMALIHDLSDDSPTISKDALTLPQDGPTMLLKVREQYR